MGERVQFLLQVEGMSCDGCARHVEEALRSVSGVEWAKVGDWRAKRAVVVASPTVKGAELEAAVKTAGYRAFITAQQPVPEGREVPAADADFDLLVIGGGSAGFAAAIRGAELGARVAIVEEGTIGGTCVNIGCVPSKTLIRAAELCYRTAYHQFEGLQRCPPPSEWQRVVQQKEELVTALREGKYLHVLEAYPTITLLRGRAQFVSPDTVQVNGQTYTAGKFLIATGSRPWAPPIPGLAESGYLDSTQALNLPALPASLIVIGGGAIGLELGQLFSRFGVTVTILEGQPRLVAVEEPEIGEALTQCLSEEGLRICTNAHIRQVERDESGYQVAVTVNGKEEICSAEQLLVATGRRPNTEHLGLEAAGVAVGARGEIVVNEHLQTTNPRIYAAGDCIGDPMYVYVAAYAGKLAAENALTGVGHVYDLTALPHVIFTDPQVASVGWTEQGAQAQGRKVKAKTLWLKDVPRAIVARETRGLIKLVADAETGQLMGAHLLAPEAGEVVQAATFVIRFRLTLSDLVATFFPYLTMVEGLKLAALSFEKDVTHLSCCAT